VRESPETDPVGQTIAGRYRLLRLVGEGGVGRVYEAEQVLGSSPRSVAVKLLRPEWSSDAAVQARFQREAALVARLQHVNTVRIYDFGTSADGTLFIAMEFLRGRSLQRLLDEQGALPPERAERIVSQIAGSLEEAHELGIVHRDLKPENIIILDNHAAEQDTVKVLDFGIAKGQPSSGTALTKLTALGTFVGTPAYMSPEQFGGAALGPQSDIYALGVTSYQILTGRLPFQAQTAVQWAQAHLGASPPPLPALEGRRTIPEGMRNAVARALAKDPAQRQASALQFAREFAGSEPAEAARAPLPSRAVPVAARVAEAPRPVPAAAGPVPAAAGGPRTAPMTHVPEFARAAAIPRTLPIASLPPPQLLRPTAPRRGAGIKALLAAAVVLGLAFFALLGRELGLWPRADQSAEPTALVDSAPTSAPAPALIAPDPPAAPATSGAVRTERSAPAPERDPTPTARPRTPPSVTPGAPPTATSPPGGVPPVPTPGALPSTVPAAVPALPGTPPAVPPSTLPQLPPGLPGLPLPPFNLPSAAGACERCLETLRVGGNGSVVSASADDLMCNDRQGRERCETQIRELAPAVAEQAALAHDCPAALATEAAGLRLGADQERFRNVHALCVR
jgi:eukaryotic-like serine/threonine-protein kinase